MFRSKSGGQSFCKPKCCTCSFGCKSDPLFWFFTGGKLHTFRNMELVGRKYKHRRGRFRKWNFLIRCFDSFGTTGRFSDLYGFWECGRMYFRYLVFKGEGQRQSTGNIQQSIRYHLFRPKHRNSTFCPTFQWNYVFMDGHRNQRNRSKFRHRLSNQPNLKSDNR